MGDTDFPVQVVKKVSPNKYSFITDGPQDLASIFAMQIFKGRLMVIVDETMVDFDDFVPLFLSALNTKS